MRAQALFPDHYAWYILVSAMDIMLTWFILHAGGAEVNAVALHAIRLGGLWGLIALKMTSIAVVVAICEHVGRQKALTGLRVAQLAVGISALPVVFALVQLALWNGMIH